MANSKQPCNNCMYHKFFKPMSFEKYAERRRLMDAGELRFDGAYVSENNENGTNWNDLIKERENQ